MRSRSLGIHSRLAATILPVLFVLMTGSSAQAQYFGRNKVQYKDFDFQTIKTEHFDVYFYPDEREAATETSRMAERVYKRLSQIFGHDLSTRQPLILYASAPDFRQTNVIPGDLGEGTGGVTEGFKRRIVMPLAGSLGETDHVLGHELVHAFQYDIARANPQDQAGSTLERLPLWFVEGMAEYLSLGHIDPHTAMWIRDAARADSKLPSISQLDNPEYFPYRWGQAFWAFVAGRWADSAVARAFDAALNAGDPRAGLEQVTGLSEKDLSTEWHDAIRAQYGPVLQATKRASTQGRLVTDQTNKTALAVSPALSPDGTRLVYLSERDMLSVDLFVANAETGEIIRKLVNTSIDPHFSSLQFISSAGSWHPKGGQFVIGAIRGGQPELAILNTENGDRVREIPFPDLGEILNPSWSPDGRWIAFSATVGGYSDLFLYDLEKSELKRLTNDAFADLQPAWSPDGTRLAFTTDRFSTDLTTLHAGRLGLASMDPSSNRVEAIATFDRGKSINPQWAPDGRRLYFLSDFSGLTDVYVLDVAERRIGRLTNLDSGASGITALSPALSAALDANRVAFSAYEEGRIGIFLIDGRAAVGGVPIEDSSVLEAARVLPPMTRATTEVLALLSDPITGLPPMIEAPLEPYDPDLSLDFVGQPYISAGVDRFGPSYGGGIAFSLSDMLGHHNLFASVDVNTYGGAVGDIWKNTGGMVAYENLEHRWNWGLSGGQVPYLVGGFASGIANVGGQPALVEQTIVQRQTYRGVNSVTAYPFSEAFRVELGAGYQNVSFEYQVRTITTSLNSGRQLSDETETTSLADPLHMGTTNAALVYDTSVYGPTSPIAGQRSRFEISPTFGNLQFTGALADYRRYFQPARFYTIATRAMHYGRYGIGSEDSRMLPLYMGYPDLIRGYGDGSFDSSECAPGPSGDCEAYDRLVGSRMLVGNVEFRFPLLRPFGVKQGMYGPLPVEVAFFADGGVAWTKDDQPSFFGGQREPVASAGVSFRVNVLGFAVAQVDLAHPFQRPGRGWMWGFSLSPGF